MRLGQSFCTVSHARDSFDPHCGKISPAEWLFRKLQHNCYMQTAAWLASRELTERAGPWDTRLSYDDDGEFFSRLLLSSEGVRFVPTARVFYRLRGGGRLSDIDSHAKLDSCLASARLHIRYVRSMEDSDRARRACLEYLQSSTLFCATFWLGRIDPICRRGGAARPRTWRPPGATSIAVEVRLDRSAPRARHRGARAVADAKNPVVRAAKLGSAAVVRRLAGLSGGADARRRRAT